MGVNVEIKARARDPDRQPRLAAELSAGAGERIVQVDTFFQVPHGRLKLREFGPDSGELVQYFRPDRSGPKKSEYTLVPTASPAALRDALAAALGVLGTVRKTRYLYRVGQTRVHVDDVADLGWFLELEVVLSAAQTEEDGRAVATALMEKLEIQPDDLVAGAYIDLLLSADAGG